MENLAQLEALGFTLPSPAYLFGALVFGLIGFVIYRFGKKAARPVLKWIGIALMLYPYAISETWMLYLIGSGLCVGAYFYRE